MKKRVKKDNLVSREEILALLERVEARSLKEGDGQILKAVIEKTREYIRLFGSNGKAQATASGNKAAMGGGMAKRGEE